MDNQPPRDPPRTATERWLDLWPLIRDVGAFILATFILTWETVERASGDPVLVGAGVALMGIPIASLVGKAITNGGPSK